MRDVPDAVVAKAREAGAHDWLETLPALVAELADRWELRVGAAFADATEAYVAEAVRADGSTAVLKVHVPFRADAAAREITVLRVAGGRPCSGRAVADALAAARSRRGAHDPAKGGAAARRRASVERAAGG